MYDELFQNVITTMGKSPSQTVTIIFEGEASSREAYAAQQVLRERMSQHGLKINTALVADEGLQARLILGPYIPRE